MSDRALACQAYFFKVFIRVIVRKNIEFFGRIEKEKTE